MPALKVVRFKEGGGHTRDGAGVMVTGSTGGYMLPGTQGDLNEGHSCLFGRARGAYAFEQNHRSTGRSGP